VAAAAAKAEAVPDEVAITLTKEAEDEVEDAVLLPVAKAPTQKKTTTATAKKARLLELAAAKRAAPDDTAIACIAVAPTDEMSGPTTRTRSRLRSSALARSQPPLSPSRIPCAMAVRQRLLLYQATSASVGLAGRLRRLTCLLQPLLLWTRTSSSPTLSHPSQRSLLAVQVYPMSVRR